MAPLVTGALLALPVLAGAALQRSAGLGMALVASPVLVAVLGARDGVSYGNALQALLCVVVLVRTGRGTRWRAAGLLLAGALVGVPVGAVVVAGTPEAVLLVLVGGLALAAVVLALVPGAGAFLRGTAGGLGSGALAGFVNATAGVGGPMISAYALARRWPPGEFVPTAQVVLLVVNLGALVAKGPPPLPAAVWVVGGLAVLVGAALGDVLAGRLSAATGRRLVTVIALAGGVATVLRGLLAGG